MVQLQKPACVFMNGGIVPWDDAKIHIASEALIRGISVFEGIKGYWQFDRSKFALLALREHYDRLCRSARLLHLPFDVEYDAFVAACVQLVRRILEPGK